MTIPGIVTMPVRAYSYLRFSSGRQARGDSKRRQSVYGTADELDKGGMAVFAAEVCKIENAVLDASLRFEDYAVSAFRGKNFRVGAMAEFARMVREGRICSGSILILENLDRLSRTEARRTLKLFLELVEHGIVLWTATPRRRYTAESLGDLGGLIEPILHMVRAHEESQRKSDLIRAVWGKKKRAAAQGAITGGNRPGWVQVSGGQYHVPEGRRLTIRAIFEHAREGMGASRVAAWLRKHIAEHPPWGPSGTWQTEYVAKILRDRRTLGEYLPGRVDESGKYVRDGVPVPGHFPPVVTEAEWEMAQAATHGRRNKSGQAGEKEVNLFTGLAYDAETGGGLSVRCSVVKRWGRYRYLQAREAPGGKVARAKSRYEQAETGILEAIRELRPRDVLPPDATDSREGRITELTGRLVALTARKEAIESQLADPAEDPEVLASLVEIVRRVVEDRKETAAELKRLKLESQTSRGETLGAVQSLIELLARVAGTEQEEPTRRRIKAGIRRLVDGIWILPQRVSARKQILHVQIYLAGGGAKYVQILPKNPPRAMSPWDLADCDFRKGEIGDVATVAVKAKAV